MLRRVWFYFLILVCSGITIGGGNEIIELRNLYYKASISRAEAEKFYNATQSASQIDKHVIEGYVGMSWMIKAYHAYNPYNKFSYFLKGRSLLDNAIAALPDNVELRYLRFGVQTNAPAFLSYNKDIEIDKKVILERYASLNDYDLKLRIRKYMLESKYCTTSEKKTFTED